MVYVLAFLFFSACTDGGAPPSVTTAPSPTPAPSLINVSIEDLADTPGAVGLLLSGGWGGRAADPVLVVGDARFTEYDFPVPGQIRFRIPERSLLSPTAHAYVDFGSTDTVDITAAYRSALR